MKKKSNRVINCTTLKKPMTEKEFLNFIKDGEKGSFMTLSEFKRKFDNWKKREEK